MSYIYRKRTLTGSPALSGLVGGLVGSGKKNFKKYPTKPKLYYF